MEPDASTDFQQLISEIFEQQPNDGLKGVLRCFLLDDKFQMVHDYKSKLESGGSYCAFKKPIILDMFRMILAKNCEIRDFCY